MKKAEEKSFNKNINHIELSQRNIILDSATNCISSGSIKTPYSQLFQNRTLEKKNKELMETGSSKKGVVKNRRRERSRKKKESHQENLSYNTTTLSSPSSSNSGRREVKKYNKNGECLDIDIINNSSKLSFTLMSPPIQNFGNSSIQSITTAKISSCTIEQLYNFQISSVKRPCNSYLIRKRNDQYKYINLKTFIGKYKRCIFKTKISNLPFILSNLNLNIMDKKQRRYSEKLKDSRQTHIGEKSLIPLMMDNSKFVQSTYVEKNYLTENSVDNIEENSKVLSLSLEKGYEQVKKSNGNQNSTPNKDVGMLSKRESKSTSSNKGKKEKHKRNKLLLKEAKISQEKFPDYIAKDDAMRGVEDGSLIKGFLRINPKNSRDSYVSNEDTSLPDYCITSIVDRNRALEGDEVVLLIKPESEWSEGKKTARVVYILNQIHPRTLVGTLGKIDDRNEFASLIPRDKRLPVIQIPSVSWPNGFKINPKLYQNILFTAKLVDWIKPNMAIGVITDTLGLSGDLRVETLSILKEFSLDVTPFSAEMKEFLPVSKEIPAKELEYREDIRKECVFTIDPLTARDLDDAVSVKKLSNGNYEIGVHISDASYFLPEGTSLDEMVCQKATTIYLVDNVYHMLPVELCLHCSLLPGEDKLAFSVFWEMNDEGEIFNTRFARTVLNSCVQLAYEHAQQMIENPDKDFKTDDLPRIHHGFTSRDLSRTVNILQKIAINLREARMRNGSLRIDQVKLLFSLSPQNGEPLDFVVYENKESHRLIEEFMLLANISVAKKINECFPDIAFLRCHEPPKATMLLEAQRCLETCGIHIDISSSGGINSSLRKYITDDFQGLCRGIVLNHIFAKPMTRARYFCSSSMESEEDYAHFALSVPIYTHFTSPIRRYADIMVHRLLAASLGYSEKLVWNADRVSEIAANCNKQKYNAKRAGEASSDLYLAHYIEKHQPYIQDCVVIDVKERSFDAIVLKTGSVVRVYQNKCQGSPSWEIETVPTGETSLKEKNEFEKKVRRLIIKYRKTTTFEEKTVIVEMFSVVKVKLSRVPNTYKLEAYLLRPIPPKTFGRTASETEKNI